MSHHVDGMRGNSLQKPDNFRARFAAAEGHYVPANRVVQESALVFIRLQITISFTLIYTIGRDSYVRQHARNQLTTGYGKSQVDDHSSATAIRPYLSATSLTHQ